MSIFPYGTRKPGTPPPRPLTDPEKILRYLREHGNYLAPGEGITVVSGIAVVLRGLMINLIVWLPIFATMMLFAIVVSLPAPNSYMPGFFRQTLRASALLAIIFGLVSLVYSWMTYKARVSIMPGGFVAGLIRFGDWVAEVFSLSYRFRRFFERWLRWLLIIAGILLLVSSVPIVHHQLGGGLNQSGLGRSSAA